MPKILYKSKEIASVVKLEFVEIANPVFKSLEVKKKESEAFHIDSQVASLRSELEVLMDKRTKLQEEISSGRELAKREIEEESSRVLKEANEQASKILDLAREKSDILLREAEGKKEAVEREANSEIEKIVKEYEDRLKSELEVATTRGRKEGYEAGFSRGCEDFDKLLGKLNNIIASLVSKRKEILESSGDQIMKLVMQIAVKVVKRIVDTQKGVVIENVNEALKKVKNKTNIVIRVNLDDLDVVAHEKAEFISRFDFIEHLEVVEDMNIGRGGCVIETDFGEIDARISSQLDRIEERLKNFA
ncbi:flagellar assembly protein FliH [Borrelia sp. BU AG58]|uniref:flagellar assembly protein FliH n=1 Tax=Borrelia sp. BU AG58 TaxID=2887345 RepID=UPI001E6037B2|nr:flagellar assembly protein FliH [Borrelia sp. BU AG58]UER67478.1 flagellar assembly protein FliH [Borrelia sp. BU AG58]